MLRISLLICAYLFFLGYAFLFVFRSADSPCFLYVLIKNEFNLITYFLTSLNKYPLN